MATTLSTDTPKTAWGDAHIFVGEETSTGAMPTSVEDLGSIDEDSLSLETADGTVYTLKDINGKTLDEVALEPELTINFTLISPSESTRGKFWDLEKDSASGLLKVKSMIAKKHYALRFGNPTVVGSETLEAPYCKLTMKPAWAAAKGWTAECSAKILQHPKADFIFGFGTVTGA